MTHWGPPRSPMSHSRPWWSCCRWARSAVAGGHYPGAMGVVAALWRYPVKSMAGERLTEVAVGERGLEGDRLYAVRDPEGRFGSGKNSTRFRWMPGLHAFAARYDGDVPVLTFPDGRVIRGDDSGVHAELGAALEF